MTRPAAISGARRAAITGARRAVVTGGAGAIGGAICTALEANGHEVISFDLRRRAGCDGDLIVDLTDAEEVRRAAHQIVAGPGRCDVLVHAAADLTQATLAEMDLTIWRRVQAVNVEAPLLLVQALAPALAASGSGRVVLIGSDTVWQPPAAAMLPYVTSKAALIGLTRMLALALGPDGVAVTCVAPGLTDTPAARAGLPESAFTDVLDRQTLARTLVPEDVAATVAFLASPAGAALTGQTVCVDGGLITR